MAHILQQSLLLFTLPQRLISTAYMMLLEHPEPAGVHVPVFVCSLLTMAQAVSSMPTFTQVLSVYPEPEPAGAHVPSFFC